MRAFAETGQGSSEPARASTSTAAALQAGARVDVYRNLNRAGVVWSVRCRRSGRVVAHVTELHLDDVRFVVQPAGARRARREGVRNVHAFARGVVTEEPPAAGGRWVRVSYDPFSGGGFRTERGPVTAAAVVRFDARGAHVR